MSRQQKWDIRYMRIARNEVEKWSKDPSTRVGAVLVRENNTIAGTGFNGFPPGHPDDPELYNDRAYKYQHVVHAEINALDSISDPNDAVNATLYVSFPICPNCLAEAHDRGVRRVVCLPINPTGRSKAWIDEWKSKVEESVVFASKNGMILEVLCGF